MKKSLALILVLVLIAAMFSGCSSSGDTDSTATPAPTESTGATDGGGDTEDVPPVDSGSYNFAKGKFEFNADGYVDEAFEYELPLSTTDEVLTYWTTCWTPQYLPEGGWAELETMANIEELTGVHIEYEAVTGENRTTNFSVLLAADDMRDIMDQANFFWTGTQRAMIDDGYFINFYDYREYMPNYLYNLWERNDIDVLKYGRVDDTTWPAMFGMLIDPAPATSYMLREDIMADLGLGAAEDIKTFDQWHDVLVAFKNNGVEWPLAVYSTIELVSGFGFAGYNTGAAVTDAALPASKIIDGQVRYTLTTQDDYDLVSMLNQWYSEGLINPNYASFGDNTAMSNEITTGVIGCVVLNPSEVGGWESSSTDPDARFMPTPRIKKTEDQILQYGQKVSDFHYGSASVSATGTNIELACTWLDWKWSPDGIEVDNWGVEGLIYEINENGEKQLTDFVLNNPDGLGSSWLMLLYTNDALRQPCLNMHKKQFAYPGGEVYLHMYDTYTVPEEEYGGEYDFPTGITYTEEQSEKLNQYSNDIATYIGETWFAFFDGSKPLSEWDAYVAQLYNLGLGECEAVLQEAYEAYIA